MKTHQTIALLICATTWATAAGNARAHDPVNPFPDIEVHANSSQQIFATYPFTRTPIIAVSDTGFAGLHSLFDPGFIAGLDDPANGLLELPLSTTIGMELLAVEPGLQFRINGITLDSPSEMTTIGTHDNADRALSDLHQHGEFQLLVDPSGERAFAEGQIHFRLYDSAQTHSPSDPQHLTLSNGYLPAPSFPDNSSNKCLKSVAKEAGKLLKTTHQVLAKCLALADAIVNLGASANSASKTCGLDTLSSNTMIWRIERARTKAFNKIARSCGPLSSVSTPLTLSAVQAHLDMYRCRAEELAAATYNNARDLITGAIEAQLFGSACVGNVCIGGIADGIACSTSEDCKTKTLVSSATTCLNETSTPE